MHAFAGITYINLGGKERPLKFGTNSTARFCEIRSIDLNEYSELFGKPDWYANVVNIRDLIYSGLWAGAKSEKMPTDFDNFAVGDWIDAYSEGYEALIHKLSEAILGKAIPNEKAQAEPEKVPA